MKIFKKKEIVSIDHVDPDGLYAPIKGILKPIQEVEDPVFSTLMMGDGIAIEPESENLYSPINGTVCVVFPSKHVIGIRGNDGKNIILHIGIDTVELNGAGFYPQVKVNDSVRAGDLLMKIDLKTIRKKHQATLMLVVENETELEHIKINGPIMPGEEIIKIKRE